MTTLEAHNIKRTAIFMERRMLSGLARKKNNKIKKRKKLNGRTQAIRILGSEMKRVRKQKLAVMSGSKESRKWSKTFTRNISSSIMREKILTPSKIQILNSLREIATKSRQMQNVGLKMKLSIRNTCQMRTQTFTRIIATS